MQYIVGELIASRICCFWSLCLYRASMNREITVFAGKSRYSRENRQRLENAGLPFQPIKSRVSTFHFVTPSFGTCFCFGCAYPTLKRWAILGGPSGTTRKPFFRSQPRLVAVPVTGPNAHKSSGESRKGVRNENKSGGHPV